MDFLKTAQVSLNLSSIFLYVHLCLSCGQKLYVDSAIDVTDEEIENFSSSNEKTL